MRATHSLTRTLIAAALLLATAAFADLHPNRDRGFTPGRVYDVGDVDNINLYNGNLVVTIPIGPTYTVGGNLSYRLTLVHTGNPWSMYRELRGPQRNVEEQWPNPRSNAGLGWQVTLGQMILPDDPFNTHETQQGWVYLAPDGSEHNLGTDPSGQAFPDRGLRRTRDVLAGQQKLEKADGSIHRFDEQTGQLESIEDRFGYRITVDTTSTPGEWKISDSTGRQHRIVFKINPANSSAMVIDYIELAAFGGKRAKYEFGYQPATILRACEHDTRLGTPLTASVALLESVKLPDGNAGPPDTRSRYSFTYEHGNVSNPSCGNVARTSSGLLRTLTLPTGGQYAWTWQMYALPIQPSEAKSFTSVPGIHTRTRTDITGTAHTWRYEHSVTWDVDMVVCDDPPKAPPEEPRPCFPTEAITSVFAPDETETRHYFSAYPGGAQGTLTSTPTSPFDPMELNPDQLGLNFSLGKRVGPADMPRFLSSETYVPGSTRPVRREYRRFEGGKRGRLRASRTIYRDDCTNMLSEEDDTCRFQDALNSGYDGYGNYRQTSTIGNFVSGEQAKTTFTNRQGVGPAGEWVLNTYTEQCSALEATQRTTALSSCAELPGADITKFTFNRATGFLEQTRVLAGAAESATDVLTKFTRTTPDSRTEQIVERREGGDLCGGVRCGEYSITSVYRDGVLTTAGPTNGTFLTTDVTPDPSTGLAATARDISGKAAVTYVYDAMGRLESVTPEGGQSPSLPRTGSTTYQYSSGTTPVTVTERRYHGVASGAALVERSWVYDGFGRISKEIVPHPEGTSERTTLYDALGRVWKVSGLGNQSFTTTTYDVFGRTVSVTSPDGSAAHAQYTGGRLTERKVARATTETTETDTYQCEVYDALGRLAEVHEGVGWTSDKQACAPGAISVTLYGYDVSDRLMSVAMRDGAVVQQRAFVYDKRGFLVSESHPERVQPTRYRGHDARGRATRKIDGAENGPFDVTFVYDSAERLVDVLETSTRRMLKHFEYYDANFSDQWNKGKLKSATRTNKLANGVVLSVTDTFIYAGRDGLTSKKTTVVTSDSSLAVRSFEQKFEYDVLGNQSIHEYPTCNTCTTPGPERIVFTDFLTGKGFLMSVSGFIGVNGIRYWPNGMMRQINHTNGVTESQAVDASGMARPASFTVAGWEPPCETPTLQGPDDKRVAYGAPAELRVSVPSPAGVTLQYEWFRQTSGEAAVAVGGNSPILTLASVTDSASYWVRVTNPCAATSKSANSRVATVAIELATPGRVVATQQGGAIVVEWPAVAGATSYTVHRQDAVSNASVQFTSSSTVFEDYGATVFEGYLYWVVANRGTGTSSPASPSDSAVKVLFTAPAVAKDVKIKAMNLAELRRMIDALRRLAKLDPAWGPNYEPTMIDVAIRATDWAEMFEKLGQARQKLYSDHGIPLVNLGVAPVAGAPISYQPADKLVAGVR